MKQLIAIIFVLLIPVVAFAGPGDVVIDPEKLTPQDAATLYQLKKNAENPMTNMASPDNLEKYAKIGEGVAKALGAACKELSVNVNEFIQTPAGKLTTFLIVWKIIGKDIVGILGGTVMLIVVLSILIWSYRRLFLRERIKNKETGEIRYVERFQFRSGEAQMSAAAVHIILFVVVWIAWLIIIF